MMEAVPQMADSIRICHLFELPPEVEALRFEAITQGFGFMDRLTADWVSGANTFSRRGECFLGYLPRTDVGRLRHVYVLDERRRQGSGRLLVARLLDEARRSFGKVRLRTDTERAASFYVRCGFSLVNDPTASHAMNLA